MITLRQRAQEYLAMRRALGFKLSTWGAKLMSFVGYLESTGARVITTDAAVAWATSTPRASTDAVHWSRRLDVVRIFARHLKTLDAATEVPPDDILPHHYRRITPYLYSPEEIIALLAAAGRLTPALRGRTWQTVLGLLAVTGLRVSEACRLDRGDVDLQHGVLTVRDSKFGKSRDVPVHASTTAALRDYDRQRDQLCPAPVVPSFFVSTRGTRLDSANMPPTFAALLAAAGIDPIPGRRRQRIHDLRHSFTVATLLDSYRAGLDVQARLPLLATYLGHTDPKSTYWYLSEGSGIASGGRETAGHQVSVATKWRLRLVHDSCLTRTDRHPIASDAGYARPRGWLGWPAEQQRAAAPLPLLGALSAPAVLS